MNTELQTLETAWAELDAEFAELAKEEQDFSGIDLEQFEALVADADLTSDVQIDIMMEEGILDVFNPKKWWDWIKKLPKTVSNLVKVARSYGGRYPDVLAAVAKVVSLFKAKDYAAALKASQDAYNIINRYRR